MDIVVLAPSGRYSADALPGLAETDRVTVVSWVGAPAVEADEVLELRQSPRSARVVAVLSRSLAGRMLVRVLPLDGGARFWRASVAAGEVARRIGEADLIIAAERDGGFAAWKWMRNTSRTGAPPAVVRGYAAARARISRR
ncbi:hypothetical protein [Agromyces lapidis]|uniref:Uncharacterized protein n=1 Tax=Agromyces lapidis TaxID=279574 RepID=A0ABV5SRB2_9MICO|nr:hypothetical protein [Agromyces lapidis]